MTDFEQLSAPWYEVLEQIDLKYKNILEPRPNATNTLMHSQAPRNQHEMAKLHRAYQEEREPILRAIAKIKSLLPPDPVFVRIDEEGRMIWPNEKQMAKREATEKRSMGQES